MHICVQAYLEDRKHKLELFCIERSQKQRQLITVIVNISPILEKHSSYPSYNWNDLFLKHFSF